MTLYVWPTESINATISGVATEATQLLNKADLDAILVKETSIDTKITACNTGAIVGTVTANAGTNLNTNALALESGGHLAAIDSHITACNTGAIAGTVTANAGTNLNTSALALETGGNLATIAGKDFATQTTLAALNTKVTAVDTTNLATSANQTSTNTKLDTLHTDLGTLNTTSTFSKSSGTTDSTTMRVVVSSNQTAIPMLMNNSLIPVSYDNIAVNLSGATADVYTYKVGAGTVATLTINYSDATKVTISSIVRT